MNDDRPANEPEERSWIEKIGQLFSSEPRNRNDLEDVLSVAAENEVIDEDARSIMEGAMQVSDMQARDIMIPRAQMVVIRADSPLEEMLPQIIQAAHSRYPVIGESHDDILGILLAKDLLPQILENDHSTFRIEELLRPTVVVPESKRLNVLLREFRENRNHMAIVIDEYGGVSGLITIEDVLEEIVGEIGDEYDEAEEVLIQPLGGDRFLVQALTPIEDLNEKFGSDLSDDDYDTVGGLLLAEFGRVPEFDEVVTLADRFEFRVVKADNRRIITLEMNVLA